MTGVVPAHGFHHPIANVVDALEALAGVAWRVVLERAGWRPGLGDAVDCGR